MIRNNKVVPRDLAGKIGETPHFLCAQKWGSLDRPASRSRSAHPEKLLIPERDG